MNRIARWITAATDLAERIGKALEWLSPALARLTVGLVFFQSGWGKLHDLEKVTKYFTELGIAAPAFQARLASTADGPTVRRRDSARAGATQKRLVAHAPVKPSTRCGSTSPFSPRSWRT